MGSTGWAVPDEPPWPPAGGVPDCPEPLGLGKGNGHGMPPGPVAVVVPVAVAVGGAPGEVGVDGGV